MSQIQTWDFTLKCEEPYDDKDKVAKHLNEFCKKHSTFQLEKSVEGYLHWQGRVITKKQFRKTEIFKKYGSGEFLHGIHWSITSNHEKGNMDYCTKDHTRVEGAWTLEELCKNKTWQLKVFEHQGVHIQWHLQTIELIRNPTVHDRMRTIYIIYDPIGNACKSLFIEYLEFQGGEDSVEEIPPFRLMDQIFEWVFHFPNKKAYVVDLPRGMNKKGLADFYSGMEVIKNGVAYERRYAPKKIRFNRPLIFVFTNTLPKAKLMSKDRWVIYEIQEDQSMKEISLEEE